MQNIIRWETFWDRIINWVITEFWPCFNKHRDLVIQKNAVVTLSPGRWATLILRGCFGLKQVSEFLLRIPFRLCWLAIDTHFNIGYLFWKNQKWVYSACSFAQSALNWAQHLSSFQCAHSFFPGHLLWVILVQTELCLQVLFHPRAQAESKAAWTPPSGHSSLKKTHFPLPNGIQEE